MKLEEILKDFRVAFVYHFAKTEMQNVIWKDENFELKKSFEDDNIWLGIVHSISSDTDFDVCIYKDNDEIIIKNLETGDTTGMTCKVVAKNDYMTIRGANPF